MTSEKKSKILKAALSILILGAIVVFAIQYLKLRNELDLSQQELSRQIQFNEALKKKYAEEKNKGLAFQKAKMTADSRIRNLEGELSDLETRVKLENEAVIADLNQKLSESEKQLASCTEDLKALTIQHQKLEETAGQLRSTLKLKESEIQKYDNDLQQANADLSEAKSKINRIVGQNARFAKLSTDLLAEFDKKDALVNVLKKEPFTQVKRVELEQMIQECLDKIDKNTLTEDHTK